ncbi:MAG: CRISPR-associated CARF protein Csa3 [Candidatus Micrarchaeota archaeon]|nr:CRISPR-associated CARF protein Csa3 [Candidatus Micrarchaeota archaeon]
MLKAEKKKVLIATIYSYEPVMISVTKIGPDKLILLIDQEPDQKLRDSIRIIKEALSKVIKIEEVQIKQYDIVDTAAKVVGLIDEQPKDWDIYANISAARKTKALGLLFGCYARIERVKKIVYITEEDNSIIYLPRLSFYLSTSEKQALQEISKSEDKEISIKEIAKKVGLSAPMLYKIVEELRKRDFIETKDGLKLTDAGKIAKL